MPFTFLARDTRLGAYKVLGEMGRGGMAIVYRAERADGQYEEQFVCLSINVLEGEGFLTVLKYKRSKKG